MELETKKLYGLNNRDMITIAIIFTFFYLKYLRRFIITYRRKKAKGEDISNWREYDATYVEVGILVISGVLAVILAIVLLISAIKYLP